MREEIARAAARIEDVRGDTSAPASGYLLRADQARVFRDFAAFLMDITTRPTREAENAFGRIILPPRTGKTVIAGHIIARTGLRSTFIVPTRTLVVQTARELRAQMPNTPVGVYFGEKKELVEAGANVATYSILLRDHARGGLPDPIASSALVFADEAHRAMTPDRMDLLHRAFPPDTVRVALTATPDYDDERVLCRFFPRLIHEVTLEEAFALDLLAPARVWVAEVDAEGSRVRILAGDYEEATLGRVMSSAPFSRAVEVFRYGDGNAQMPALIACTSRQQAYDLGEYLCGHRPAGATPPEIVLGETSAAERARILGGFDAGTIDTLIQVGVLLEGWNSPRCKLLLDLAPTLSRVRATQKYFRVMTKQAAAEARIYVLVPKDLPELPILPMELFGRSCRDYECGELLGRTTDSGGGETLVDRTKGTPIAGVTLKKRIVFSGRLEAPRLEPDDVAGLRAILRTSREFDPNLPCGLHSFYLASFTHPLFSGRGRSLLRWLGVPRTTAAYAALLARAFPDGAASQLLAASEPAELPSCRKDAARLLEGLPRGPEDPKRSDNRGVDEGFAEGWRALTGFDGPEHGGSRDPLAVLLEQERADKIAYLLNALPVRGRHLLVRRFGLYGQPAETSEGIATNWRISSGRVHQVEASTLRALRTWVLPDGADLELRIGPQRRGTLPPLRRGCHRDAAMAFVKAERAAWVELPTPLPPRDLLPRVGALLHRLGLPSGITDTAPSFRRFWRDGAEWGEALWETAGTRVELVRHGHAYARPGGEEAVALRLWAEVTVLPDGPTLLLQGSLGDLEAFTVEDDDKHVLERAWREIVGLGPAPKPSRTRPRGVVSMAEATNARRPGRPTSR